MIIREIRVIRGQENPLNPLNPWSALSPQPSDISHLKKSVPLSPARCITFVAANNVRKDSGEIRKFAYAIEKSEKRPKNERYCVSSETLLHLKRNATAFDFGGGCSDPPTKDDDTAAAG